MKEGYEFFKDNGVYNLAILDERIPPQQHMLESYPFLQEMEKVKDGNTEVFYLKNCVATICSFTESPKGVKI